MGIGLFRISAFTIYHLQVVVSVEHFVIFCGHFVFLILTRPSAHNKNFPYHVRTTQIGIMQAMATNTNLGPNTLDHFANGGSYGVSAPATGKYTLTYLMNVTQ